MEIREPSSANPCNEHEQALQELDRKVRLWHQVLEDYPGTEYARIAQDQLEALTDLRTDLQRTRNPGPPA